MSVFSAKWTKFDFGWGSSPYPSGVALEPQLAGRTAQILQMKHKSSGLARNVAYHNVRKSLSVNDWNVILTTTVF